MIVGAGETAVVAAQVNGEGGGVAGQGSRAGDVAVEGEVAAAERIQSRDRGGSDGDRGIEAPVGTVNTGERAAAED